LRTTLLLSLALVFTLLFHSSVALPSDNPIGCYRNSTDRGVGVPVSACPSGTEQSGALCYPPCEANYTGIGPVCWQDCPAGYTDTGAFCQPDWVWGDNSACPSYDKCGLLYNDTRGCVKCPEGMAANGCICQTPGETFAKNSYGRGAGVVMICADGLQEQAGLCYKPCQDPNTTPVGPICWAECPSQDSYSCGGAVCVPTAQACEGSIKQFSDSLAELVYQLAECLMDKDFWAQSRSKVKNMVVFNPRNNPHRWHHWSEPRPRVSGDCNAQEIEQEIKEIIQELNLPICSDV